jgi:hypothetical protein
MDVDTARRQAAEVLLKVQTGVDVQAERQAQRGSGSFEELANRYRDEYAKHKNKSWRQPDALIAKNLMPRWAKLQAASISRSDVKSALAAIESGSTAAQTLRAASAVFSWAIKELAATKQTFLTIFYLGSLSNPVDITRPIRPDMGQDKCIRLGLGKLVGDPSNQPFFGLDTISWSLVGAPCDPSKCRALSRHARP